MDRIHLKGITTIMKKTASTADKEREARFEEGKSVDVADYLREHGNDNAAEAWDDNTDKYRDKFTKNKSAALHKALARVALQHPKYRKMVASMLRQADKWKSMPKGWTDESRDKFWGSLTGQATKHKVTACMKKMDGKVDDPGAFCASLADRVDPGWRSRTSSEARSASDEWLSVDEVRTMCPSCADKMASQNIRRVRASTLRKAMKMAAAQKKTPPSASR